MKSIPLEKVALTEAKHAEATSRSLWTTALLLTSLGSASCLLAGLFIALLTWVDLIAATPNRAYLTVGLLLASFVLIFFAAHSMDRAAAADKAERMEQCDRQIRGIFRNESR